MCSIPTCPDFPDCPVPHGTCHCGCGGTTRICAMSRARTGHIRGMPYRFIIGHKIPPAGPTYVVEAGPLSTPCWIWQRALTNRGYGSVHRGGRSIAAHVLVYEEQRGPVPAGLELDHLCRNHACVNPGHLEAVSRAVNVQRGVKAKLTAAQVAEIRAKRAVHYKQLMREYGVSASAIHYIWSNKSWKP